MDVGLAISLAGNVVLGAAAAFAAVKWANAEIEIGEHDKANTKLCDKLSDVRGDNARLTAANDKLKAELKPLREAEQARAEQRRKALAAAQARNAELAAQKKNGAATKPARKRAKA